MSFRAFLFDLDGTLVDTDPLQFQLWKHIGENLLANNESHESNESNESKVDSHTFDLPFYEQCIRGRTDDDIWNSIEVHFNIGVTPQDRTRWTTWKEQEFLRRIDETVAIRGGREFMENVHDQHTFIGIVTNSSRNVAERLIERLDVSNLVDVLIAADPTISPKPSPQPYELAMKELGVPPERTVIFEDSSVGIASALGVNPKRLYVIGAGDNGTNGNFISIPDFLDESLLNQ